MTRRLRHFVLVLGDQLSLDNPALAGFDPARDRVLMVAAPGEAGHVWSHKARIGVFFAAMRHFAASIRARSWPIDYLAIGTHAHRTIDAALEAALIANPPGALIVSRARRMAARSSDWRARRATRRAE